VSGLLREFFSAGGVASERIAVGLGTTPIIIRRFEYPFGDRTRVQAALRAEFEDTLPFEIGDHVIDYKITGRKAKNYLILAGLCPETYCSC